MVYGDIHTEEHDLWGEEPDHPVIRCTADTIEWFVKGVSDLALCDSAPRDRKLAEIAEELRPYVARLRELQELEGRS